MANNYDSEVSVISVISVIAIIFFFTTVGFGISFFNSKDKAEYWKLRFDSLVEAKDNEKISDPENNKEIESYKKEIVNLKLVCSEWKAGVKITQTESKVREAMLMVEHEKKLNELKSKIYKAISETMIEE